MRAGTVIVAPGEWNYPGFCSWRRSAGQGQAFP